ncbi:MAG: hypothetical protein Kow00109_17090 [Acidobacteriota bacterium]
MVFQTEALVLRHYPFGEAHRVVVFLSRDRGRVRAVAYGAGSPRSRFGSSLELMTHVRAVFRHREGQELAVVENCEIIQPSPAFRLGLEENLYLGYFAELLAEFTREEAGAETVFRLALASLDALDAGVELRILARYMELWLLRLEGVLPEPAAALPPDLGRRCAAMMRRRPRELVEEQWNSADLQQLEEWTGRLIESHLEKPLKSRRFLQQV